MSKGAWFLGASAPPQGRVGAPARAVRRRPLGCRQPPRLPADTPLRCRDGGSRFGTLLLLSVWLPNGSAGAHTWGWRSLCVRAVAWRGPGCVPGRWRHRSRCGYCASGLKKRPQGEGLHAVPAPFGRGFGGWRPPRSVDPGNSIPRRALALSLAPRPGAGREVAGQLGRLPGKAREIPLGRGRAPGIRPNC